MGLVASKPHAYVQRRWRSISNGGLVYVVNTLRAYIVHKFSGEFKLFLASCAEYIITIREEMLSSLSWARLFHRKHLHTVTAI
jgi:hypothetical protein